MLEATFAYIFAYTDRRWKRKTRVYFSRRGDLTHLDLGWLVTLDEFPDSADHGDLVASATALALSRRAIMLRVECAGLMVEANDLPRLPWDPETGDLLPSHVCSTR